MIAAGELNKKVQSTTGSETASTIVGQNRKSRKEWSKTNRRAQNRTSKMERSRTSKKERSTTVWSMKEPSRTGLNSWESSRTG